MPPHLPPLWAVAVITVLAFAVLAAWTAPTTHGAGSWRGPVHATWYGPGFYGNAFACSHRSDVPDAYAHSTRGTAHMTLPCGTKVTLCKRIGKWKRCVKVKVIDRGNFHHSNFDLTARTAMDLCRCERPYTQTIIWKRGWA